MAFLHAAIIAKRIVTKKINLQSRNQKTKKLPIGSLSLSRIFKILYK